MLRASVDRFKIQPPFATNPWLVTPGKLRTLWDKGSPMVYDSDELFQIQMEYFYEKYQLGLLPTIWDPTDYSPTWTTLDQPGTQNMREILETKRQVLARLINETKIPERMWERYLCEMRLKQRFRFIGDITYQSSFYDGSKNSRGIRKGSPPSRRSD